MSARLELAGWTMASLGLIGIPIARRKARGRTELMARACHELRGPLTAARLGLELASRRGQLAGPGLRAVGLELERASLALEDLTAVWERPGRALPRFEARAEAVNVVGLLEDCVEAWRPPAAARGVELRLVVPPGPVMIRGWRPRLAQAVANLIANAVEHGAGPVEVSLHFIPGRARVEVLDSGPGLPAPVNELARRRRRPRRRHGHGLAVAAGVAAAYGGELKAAPSARGARLVLSLPTAQAQPRQGGSTSELGQAHG